MPKRYQRTKRKIKGALLKSMIIFYVAFGPNRNVDLVICVQILGSILNFGKLLNMSHNLRKCRIYLL